MTNNVLIVEARFYSDIADLLLDGATAALGLAGVHFEHVSVPGALEIPTAIAFAAKSAEGSGKRYDGFVALGCVIRGETHHFKIVANESASALMTLGLNGYCIGNGILTVENESQALTRASRDGSDKGGDAARACLALIELRSRFGLSR